MKIGILGTRGIPNDYGGFEQIAGWLAQGLVRKGHSVTVYNSHNHPFQASEWNGVRIHHCYDPERIFGTAGQFIYDLNCILHARKSDYDIVLFLGYTSSSIWYPFFPATGVVVSNMDGLEWKREKYTPFTRRFLKYAERLAVKHSHFHIADSRMIKQYLDSTYRINCAFIPYGASSFSEAEPDLPEHYKLAKENYYMLMARMEPENNVEMILDGFRKSSSTEKFIVVGRTANALGKHLQKKYARDERIQFIGGLFDQKTIHCLRANTRLYFHGHSVGGTNPSLLEAMASGALIAAHDNVFNKAVLGKDAYYFSTAQEVCQLIDNHHCPRQKVAFTQCNLLKIQQRYNWEKIVNDYDNFLGQCYRQAKQ
jgi:glycosyltransferase involved in cell wall biosynthesis